VTGLFAVARALHRALAMRTPARAVAVVDAAAPNVGPTPWPEILVAQLPLLPELLAALGLQVIVTSDELDVVASYATAAREAGDDVLVVGVDKRYAQLVGDRVSWYDANKDVRYTPEIVEKRFNVPPDKVAAWLGMVGDDDELPGVQGLGAKGATTLVETYGSIEAALEVAATMDGRLGKVLRAAEADIPRELARARLDVRRALPTPLDALAWTPPSPAVLNALYERLAFAELLVTTERATHTEVVRRAEDVASMLAGLGAGPVTMHALLEDPAPIVSELAGVGLSNGSGSAFYVPVASAAWPSLVAWLEDASRPKQGHDLVGTSVALRRMGVRLAGIVGDSAAPRT
jgi:DNA polymerase-1